VTPATLEALHRVCEAALDVQRAALLVARGDARSAGERVAAAAELVRRAELAAGRPVPPAGSALALRLDAALAASAAAGAAAARATHRAALDHAEHAQRRSASACSTVFGSLRARDAVAARRRELDRARAGARQRAMEREQDDRRASRGAAAQ
jgi:hypothetical protein